MIPLSAVNTLTENSSSLQVFQIPVLQDNYIYILRDLKTQRTAVVDPALAKPVQLFLNKKKWKLDFILTTHHHWDHVGGNLALKKKWACAVAGFAKDKNRIPGIDILLKANDKWSFGSHPCRILFLPGHTLGHIAYWFFKEKKLFIGDTVFSMGCGRLFEGSFKQMFNSLSQIKSLPKDTEIFCAHEYTEKNALFSITVDSNNSFLKNRLKETQIKRRKNQATVPFLLSEELKTNPFLRAKNLEEFKTLRKKRDIF